VIVAPLLLLRSKNVTTCPLAGLPDPFVTVAVMMELCPAAREVAAEVKVMRCPVEAVEVDILVIMTTPVAPVTLAWIVSWTSAVGLVAPAV
jgi:predicted permease